MSSRLVQKPGLIWRALFAFILLNVGLALIVTPTLYFGAHFDLWWVQLGALVMFTIGEIVIFGATLWDHVSTWIKSEMWVQDK